MAQYIFTIQQGTAGWLWISGNTWLRKMQRKRYSCDFCGGIQAVNGIQVGMLWWRLSGLIPIKETVFCNTDLAYLPCHLPLPRYSLSRRRLIRGPGRVCVCVCVTHSNFWPTSHISFRWAIGLHKIPHFFIFLHLVIIIILIWWHRSHDKRQRCCLHKSYEVIHGY